MKRRTVQTALLRALACCAVLGAAYLWSVHDYQRTVAAMTFREPELAAIPDGTYTGTCDVRFIRAGVAVTVRSGRIERIDRDHRGAAGGCGRRDRRDQLQLRAEKVGGKRAGERRVPMTGTRREHGLRFFDRLRGKFCLKSCT